MKVTIITTVLNRVDSIRETIESVLAQTYQDIEYIVIDGASTDGTLDIINSYKDRISKIVSEPDKGLYEAINKGIRLATGDIVGLMHSDDFFHNNDVISQYVKRFQSTGADLIYANGIFVDKDNESNARRIWTSGKFNKFKLRHGWLPLHPTVYVKRETLLKYGLYDESYMIAADSDFLVRYLYESDIKVEYMNMYTVNMRIGGLSTSREFANKKAAEDVRMYKSHKFSPYPTIFLKKASKVPQIPMAMVMGDKCIANPEYIVLCKPVSLAIKRIFDIVISLIILLTVSWWLTLIVGLITKLQMPGPIFFKQKRTGQYGKEFNMIKFRTMRVNSQADTLQASKNDERVTRWGLFLRKTSIDEIPQILNVLKGDMSLIGPRPHMVLHTEQYSELIDDYMLRLSAKPGITGWAQVNKARGETKEVWQMEDRVNKDIWYIEHWSLWLDLRIMFLTFRTILGKDELAY